MGSLQPLLRKLRKGYRRLRNDYGEMTSVLQEVISGVRLVKSYGAEGYEERRFTDASHRYSKGMVRVVRIAFMAQPLTEIIGTGIAVVLLWIGARQVIVDKTLAGPIKAGIITEIDWSAVAQTGAFITLGGVVAAGIAAYITLRLYVRL